MDKQSKLELEFEILTLTNNIETLKKMGKHTRELQQRLDICREKLVMLTFPKESDKARQESAG